MNTTKTASHADNTVAYSGAQRIEVAQIERALSELWRQAGAAAADAAASQNQRPEKQKAVTRACLWNLVVYHGDTQVPELSAVRVALPSRTIRLATRSAEQQPPTGQEVCASVSTACNVSPGGGHQICSEEIHIEGFGDSGIAHFPALVRALLVPDLPVALLWLSDPPRKSRLLRDLLRLSDRMVIDSQAAQDDSVLSYLNGLVRESPSWTMDLGWMRLTPVRHLIAGMFDPPGCVDQLRRVSAIRIETTPNGHNSGLLLLGWILSRLHSGNPQAADTLAREAEQCWTIQAQEHRIALSHHTRAGDGGLDGLLSLELQVDGDLFALRQLDAHHVVTETPQHSSRKLALHGWDDPELIVAALGSPGLDRLYPEALNLAANLLEAEAWNR